MSQNVFEPSVAQYWKWCISYELHKFHVAAKLSCAILHRICAKETKHLSWRATP